MKKLVTTGRRFLRDDCWHDDNGPLPPAPDGWDPPMTEAEILEAALSDPDAQPSTPEALERMRPVSPAKRIRRALGLSQEEFSERFGIPLGTLRDWEQHRREPDQSAATYLKVIEKLPDAVAKALEPA